MNADFVPGVGQNSAKIPNGSELLRLGVVSRVRRFDVNLKVTRPSQLCAKKDGMNRRGKDGMNRQGKDGMNRRGKDGVNQRGKDGMNRRGKDGMNPSLNRWGKVGGASLARRGRKKKEERNFL